ncbi:MAG: aspartate kinase [Epsilonproteobacteria bacterium]|nr:aspartate kinase [Campylobacterota bacterium]
MLIVQKFGGTSVGDLERIQNVANRVAKSKDAGNDIIVVVSAMSGETNKLIGYAANFSKNPAAKEMDMLLSSGERVTSALLSIALQEMGYDAISLSGRKAGIHTDDIHTSARISHINTDNMREKISEGKIIVVAGFQGITADGDVSTLGRGGSDLSAVAIAGAMEADLCEIYTDVDGVYTTDPRIERRAKKIEKISYDEMLEFASLGAKVLQNRSVEMAKKLNVNLVTRSSFTENEGTLITKEENIMEQPIVSGIALDKNQARVSLRNVKDEPGIAANIFSTLAENNINVDMIIQNVGHDGNANLGFTVPENELENAKEIMEKLNAAEDLEFDSNIAKVSIVGVGMKNHSGVASTAFTTLADNGINIEMISTSEIKISMIVDEKYSELAVRSLHEAYNLGQRE